MQRNPSESREHADLIRMMVNYFTSQGYRNIRADLSGMTSPMEIRGTIKNHVPDLTAENNGGTIILEAETSDSIYDGHTASQWSLFADAASKSGGEFHVVVPRGSRTAAEQRAADLSIKIYTVWTPQ